MFVLYGIVALCSLAGILAKIPNNCGDVEPLQDFNMTKYIGAWYEHGHFGWRPKTQCTTYTFRAKSSGKIWIDYFAIPLKDQNYIIERSGEVHVPDASKPAQFEVTKVPYRSETILGTDYTSYSIECVDCYFTRIVKIITREPNPPQSVVDEAMRVMREKGLSTEEYSKTDQSCSKLI